MLGGKKKDTMIEMKSSKSKALVEYREEKKCKNEQYKNYYSKSSGKQLQHQARSFTLHNSTVTYGNADGSYISSSRTRMTGSEGVTLVKSKETETAIRQGKRISSETATRLGQLKISDTATGWQAKRKSSDTATGQAKPKSSNTATKQAKPKSSNTATKQVKPKISGGLHNNR
ncbi:uncharacterized protein LOC132166189 isoform X2 [Corylus avellana]|nr:uncharacterized protein LOC132166189 isoform X2 [Corylus avellana]